MQIQLLSRGLSSTDKGTYQRRDGTAIDVPDLGWGGVVFSTMITATTTLTVGQVMLAAVFSRAAYNSWVRESPGLQGSAVPTTVTNP